MQIIERRVICVINSIGRQRPSGEALSNQQLPGNAMKKDQWVKVFILLRALLQQISYRLQLVSFVSHKFPGIILWWVWCVCVVTIGCRGMWRRQTDSSSYSMWRSSWGVACVSEILRLTMVNTKWVTELETIKEDTNSVSGTKQFNLHLTRKLRKQSKIIVIYYLFSR